MKEFVITLRREHRATMHERWTSAIRHMDGVEVVLEDDRFEILKVRATESAIENIRQAFGGWIDIEASSADDRRD